MLPKPSKQFGSLFTLLALVVTVLGLPSRPARPGAPASANFALNSLSTPITTITRASVASNGTQANGDSWMPVISADGRTVAFQSKASNLVSGDTNAALDVFVVPATSIIYRSYQPRVIR